MTRLACSLSLSLSLTHTHIYALTHTCLFHYRLFSVLSLFTQIHHTAQGTLVPSFQFRPTSNRRTTKRRLAHQLLGRGGYLRYGPHVAPLVLCRLAPFTTGPGPGHSRLWVRERLPIHPSDPNGAQACRTTTAQTSGAASDEQQGRRGWKFARVWSTARVPADVFGRNVCVRDNTNDMKAPYRLLWRCVSFPHQERERQRERRVLLSKAQ